MSGAGPPHRPLGERLVGALPWLGLGLAILIFYWIEASLRRSPWLFTDELEWSQLSRAIAVTGHPARRGLPSGFESLYSYLIAPAWWIHSTASAYAAIKYLNALVMCLTAVPVYLLSRQLVERRAAVTVALLSIAIPAMSYATFIVPESLAYLWFAVAAWLAIRALAAPSPAAVALAVGGAAVGPLIREEFVTLPAAVVLAAAAMWVLRERERAIPWQRALLGLAAVVIFGYLFNRYVVEHFQSRRVEEYLNRHTLKEGALAFGALAIGLGIVPVIGGFASLRLPERRGDSAYRAFSFYLAASILTLVVYTAAKETLLLGSLGPLIEERNLFYLSPLLLLGTAIVVGARKLSWPLIAAATLLVLLTVWSRLFQVSYPNFEAPGLDVLSLVNREFIWTVQDFHRLLVGATVVGLALLAVRGRRWAPPLLALLVCAWLLTGEIYATIGNDDEADTFAGMLTPPRNWVDEDTHRGGTTFLVQGISNGNANPLLLLEFWNRSLDRMAGLDASATGPGPTFIPGLLTTDGVLSEFTGNPYTLASPGVDLAAPVVARHDGFTLYHTPGHWQLADQEQNVYADGWAGSPFTYSYYAKGGPGTLTIRLNRDGFRGSGPPGRATIRIGTVEIDQGGGPELRSLVAVRHAVVPNGKTTVVKVHVAATPFIVWISFGKTTFVAPPDTRQLAAKPGFSFVRDRS